MYMLSDELHKLLSFDLMKIVEGCRQVKSPQHPERTLQAPDDYFAQSFVTPENYFFFRYRKIYIAIVLTNSAHQQLYHVMCEHYMPRLIPLSELSKYHLLAKNFFGDFTDLFSAFKAFSECVHDVCNTYLGIPHQWQQLELF